MGGRNKYTKLLVAAVIAPLLGLAILLGSPQPVAGTAPADATALFKSKCATCHGVDGSGNTAYGKREKLRDLGSREVQGQPDAHLYAVTAKGKGKMPGYEKTLGADSCKALVGHVRTFKR
jgi:cytochrome c6